MTRSLRFFGGVLASPSRVACRQTWRPKPCRSGAGRAKPVMPRSHSFSINLCSNMVFIFHLSSNASFRCSSTRGTLSSHNSNIGPSLRGDHVRIMHDDEYGVVVSKREKTAFYKGIVRTSMPGKHQTHDVCPSNIKHQTHVSFNTNRRCSNPRCPIYLLSASLRSNSIMSPTHLFSSRQSLKLRLKFPQWPKGCSINLPSRCELTTRPKLRPSRRSTRLRKQLWCEVAASIKERWSSVDPTTQSSHELIRGKWPYRYDRERPLCIIAVSQDTSLRAAKDRESPQRRRIF